MENNQENNQKIDGADFETAITHTGYGRYNYLMILLLLPGMFSSALCSTTISYILPAAQCDLELSNFDKGTLNSIGYGGLISGALFWGILSDNLGRRNILMIAFFMDGFFSIISSFAQTLWFLQLFRFAVGFANAGPYSILLVYLSEFHSIQHRSRIVVSSALFAALALTAIPGFAWLLLPQTWSLDLFDGTIKYNSWNVFIAVCGLPSIISGLSVLFFKESPKFLMSKGLNQKAMEVLKHVYSSNTGKHPDTYPITELRNELSSTAESTADKNTLMLVKDSFAGVSLLFSRMYLPKAILVFSIKMFSHYGLNTLRLWTPQIFTLIQEYLNNPDNEMNVPLCEMITRNQSVPATDINDEGMISDITCTVYVSDPWIYLSSMIIGAVYAGFSIAAIVLINILGKRILAISFFLIAGICGLSIYWSLSSAVTTGLLAVYQATIEVSFICLIGVVVELFPTSLRTVATTLSMMFGRVGSLTGILVFPILLDLNCELPFFLTSALILVCSLACWLLPAAKKVALK